MKEDNMAIRQTSAYWRSLNAMNAYSGGMATIVDIAKAFDTISHAALKQCLQRKGVSERVASYIDLMYGLSYEYCWTIIRMESSDNVRI